MFSFYCADDSHEMSSLIFSGKQQQKLPSKFYPPAVVHFNPGPAEPGYALHLQTV